MIKRHITTETCHKQTEPEELLIKKLDRTSVYAYIILSTAREVIWCVKFDTSCRILFGKKINRNHPKQTSANITLPYCETPCPTPQCPNAWSLEKHSIVPVHLFSEVIGRIAQLFRSITNLICKCSRSHHHTWLPTLQKLPLLLLFFTPNLSHRFTLGDVQRISKANVFEVPDEVPSYFDFVIFANCTFKDHQRSTKLLKEYQRQSM